MEQELVQVYLLEREQLTRAILLGVQDPCVQKPQRVKEEISLVVSKCKLIFYCDQ